MIPFARVRRPGLLDTVQDLGRPGLGRFGVSPSGAMDPLALRAANRLAGNPDGAAALEVTAVGPALELLAAVRFALAGGDLCATLDGRPLEVWRGHAAPAGAVLAFGRRRQGARCYLAVAGGVAAPGVLGSAASDVDAGLGLHPLRAGDVLARSEALGAPVELPPALRRAWADPFTLRFVPDPGAPPLAVAGLAAGRYRVTRQCSRMGFRLDGPSLPDAGAGLLSEPVPPGAIQLPPGGQPILLMADRPTVGGYPRLGCVIAADLPKAGQLWIGHDVRFVAVSLTAAHLALRQQAAWLAGRGDA